jgi:DNA-binding beta-propeller fold protein YncE
VQYETQGESKIYAVEFGSKAYLAAGDSEAQAEILTHEGVATNAKLVSNGVNYNEPDFTICARPTECKASAATPGNIFRYIIDTTEPGNVDYWEGELYKAYVYITQEHYPELSWNTSSPTIEGRQNVVYGSGGWLSPVSGAFEVKSHDPGVGIGYAGLYEVGGKEELLFRKAIFEEGLCGGIQCSPTYNTPITYNPLMPNGEDDFEWYAEDGVGWDSWYDHKVKVDATPPEKLEVSGWPKNREISAAPHTLTVEATDGTKPTLSSGVKSISVSLDGGKESVVSGATCSPGECTASGKYTIDAENLTEGVHRLVVTATDNAGNVAPSKEWTFDVRHATPVSFGPGTVDPTTGQFELDATDVSLGGTTGVSRVYQSRNLGIGVEGPLGPQWALNLGGSEDLTVLPEGDVALTGVSGGRTTFTLNSKGEFESPLGDSNLKLQSKEAEKGKGITEYLLTNATAGTTTRFTQPAGTQKTTPIYTNQFGAEATQLKNPVSTAIDSSGNVWTTDYGNNRIVKSSSAGALLAAYGSKGSESRQFINPWGVAANQSTGNVYVTDQGNSRVDELSPTGTFIEAFGWGVKNGNAEFEICKSACRLGIPGAGAGQVYVEAGIAVDSSGNVWVADYGNNRIEEFNEKGEFTMTFGFGVANGEAKLETCTSSCRAGLAGTENGELNGPFNIAFSGGHLYVTDYHNNRVEEFSTAGAYVSKFGSSGTGNGQFTDPYGLATDPATGNLYVSDYGNKRVQEFSSAGSFITKFGAAGTAAGQFEGPTGIAVNSSGGVYVDDFNNNRVEEWTRPSWLPTLAEGSLKSGTTSYAYEATEVEEGKTIIEPIEALTPPPSGVSCGTKPEELKEASKKGCRGLTFEYAHETTATGENESAWGDYKGRLKRVEFHAWDPSKGAMTKEVFVAQYAYDKQGRLRAEWDPRISPALKTIYGYDAEGHVTAVTRSGYESWALSYGTTATDSNAGRLLKATQAPASAKLWGGEAPKNTEVPKISGTAVVGVTMGGSAGTWGNEPVAYGYQWEDCNSTGEGCTPILGSINANYTVASSDVGHTIKVQVTAINGGGSAVASSLSSAVVTSTGTKTEGTHYTPGPGSTIEYHLPLSGTGLPTMTESEVAKWGQKDDPTEGMATFPPDEPQSWPATSYKRATILYLDAEGRAVNSEAPSGGISTTEYNETNNVTRTLSADNRATALKEAKPAEASELLDTKNVYSAEGGELLETRGPQHIVKLSTGAEVKARNHAKYIYDQGAKEVEEKTHESYSLVTESTDGAEYEGKEADIRTTKTSYGGQGNLGWTLRKPTSVTNDPGGLNLTSTTKYDENTGDVLETQGPATAGKDAKVPPAYLSQFGTFGSGNGQLSSPKELAVDPKGNEWIADTGNNRIEEFNEKGEFVKTIGSLGTEAGKFTEPKGIAIDSKGNVWVADTANNRLEEFNEKGEYLKTYGALGSGNDQFNTPRGISFDSHNNIWVADAGNNRVEELNEKGEYIKSVGSSGTGNGQFKEPKGVPRIDSKGNLWEADTGNDRVEEFNEKGEWVRSVGSLGSGNGQFNEPKGIAIDSRNDIWVADDVNNRVEEFNEKGEYLAQFGTKGSGNGQFRQPWGG